MKHWLIIYDIREPKRLRKVAKVMESYGIRVQKSVFEMIANRSVVDKLRQKIRQIIMEEDFVVYFDICEKDWQKQMKYGPDKFKTLEDEDFYIL